MPRNGEKPEDKSKGLPLARVLRPGYEQYKEQGNEDYRYARSLKIPSEIASDLRHKSREEIEKVARELARMPL